MYNLEGELRVDQGGRCALGFHIHVYIGKRAFSLTNITSSE